MNKILFFKKYFKSILLIALIGSIALILRLFSFVSTPLLIHIQDQTMGTIYNIKIVQTSQAIDKKELKKQINAKLKHINKLMSMFDNTSEISTFNNTTNTDWFKISPETLEVIKEAFNIYEISNHSYDITIAPLVNLWNFGVNRTFNQFKIPDKSQIEKIKQHVGMHFIHINEDQLMIKKLIPTVSIDLSSIAKGYAVDYIANFLKSLGLNRFMVEIGGEVYAIGTNQNNEEWKIGIETPTTEYNVKQSVQKVIKLNGMAIATSGNYRNYFEKDGIRYTHIINPITGYPITHKLASVSVIDNKCVRADALATALMLLGENDGFEIAQKNKIMAYFIIKTNDGFITQSTHDFVF